MESMPNIKLFHEEDIQNYEVQQKILYYYGLQGQTYSAVKKAINWLINYRLNATVEFRPPWSDNFTRGQNGDLSYAEGCWTVLFILFINDENEISKYIKDGSILFQYLKEDLYKCVTQKVEANAARAIIDEALEQAPNDPELLANMAKSPLPYVSYSPDIENVISTETISYLIRIVILYIRLKLSQRYKKFFESIEKEIPKFDEYLRRILKFLVNFVTSYAISYKGFGAVLNAPDGWNREIDLYNTYIMVKTLTEFQSLNIKYPGFDKGENLSRNVLESINCILDFVLRKRCSIDNKIGWSINYSSNHPELDGTVFGLLILSKIFRFYSLRNEKTEFDLKKTANEVLVDFIIPTLSSILNDTTDFNGRNEISRLSQLELMIHQTWAIKFAVTDIYFYYINALTSYLINFGYEITHKGKRWKWSIAWDSLIRYVESILSYSVQLETTTGFCLRRTVNNKSIPLVSLKATARALEVLNEFGIDKDAESGMIDVVKDILLETSNSIVKKFHQKYSEFEKLGFRIAWKNIQSDFETLSHSSISNVQIEITERALDVDEFELLLKIESLIPKLKNNQKSRGINSWKAGIRSIFIEKGIPKKNIPNHIFTCAEKADEFNRNVEEFINSLIRTSDANKFRVICHDMFTRNKVIDIPAFYDIHRKMIEMFSSVKDDSLIEINHKRLEFIRETLDNLLKEK